MGKEIPAPLTAALLELVQRGIPADVQHLLVAGSLSLGVAPGALAAAIDAALEAAEEAEAIANTCDVPGCGKPASCGWPSENGYRRTCHWHSPFARHPEAGADG